MARIPITDEKKRVIIQDWKYGKFKNYFQLQKEHGISSASIKKIILASKAVHGSEAEEYERLLNNHTNATRDFAHNPTSDNDDKLKTATDLLPNSSLTDLLDMIENSTGIIADEIISAVENRLINSNIIMINAKAHRNIQNDEKTIMVSAGKDGSYAQTVPLDSGDLKNYVEIADKSKIALGLAPRFAPKNDVNVMTQVNGDGEVVQAHKVGNNIDSFYNEDKVIEG